MTVRERVRERERGREREREREREEESEVGGAAMSAAAGAAKVPAEPQAIRVGIDRQSLQAHLSHPFYTPGSRTEHLTLTIASSHEYQWYDVRQPVTQISCRVYLNSHISSPSCSMISGLALRKLVTKRALRKSKPPIIPQTHFEGDTWQVIL